VKFLLTWVYRMRWWLLVVAVLVLAYTVGAPKDHSILEWVANLIKGAA
jgi:hypothetical protein